METWLAFMEIYYKGKIHTGFQKVSIKTECKIFSLYIDDKWI